MKNFITFAFMVSILISCQTIEITAVKSNCEDMDWYEIGRADSVLGKTSGHYEDKSNQCNNFQESHRAQYLNGWNAGLDSFCTHKQGFVLGRQGRGYEKICPDNKAQVFIKGYDQGLKVYNYEKNNKQLAEELQKTSQLVESTPSSSHSELFKKINRLETELELNRALIAEIQNQVEANTSPTKTF